MGSVKYNKIVIFLVVFSYLKPFNASLIGPIDTFYKVLKLAATALMLITLFYERVPISRGSVFCLAWVGIWAVSILRNNGSFAGCLQQILSIVVMILLIEYLKGFENGLDSLLRMLHHFAIAYIILQFVTLLIGGTFFAASEDPDAKFFLGADNYSAFTLIPMAGFMLAYEARNENKISIGAWIVAVIGFLCLAIPFSVAGSVAYFALLVLVALRCYPAVRKLASVRNVLILVAVFVAVIVASNADARMNFTVLGKTGLNSREVIWPRSYELFLQHPLLGYGQLTQAQIDTEVLWGMGHAHNIVLEFLLEGGLIGTALASCWLYTCLKNTSRAKSRVVDCLMLCLAAYTLCGIFDFYISSIYFWMLVNFINAYKNKELHLLSKAKSTKEYSKWNKI